MYLFFKLLHIFFIISWFAGLFYLPRIFVNLAMVEHESERERLLLMAQKLYKFMTPWGMGALICGLIIPYYSFGYMTWVWVKISLGLILALYHLWCGQLLKQFLHKQNRHSHKWYRFFNELPVFILLAALYFVIYKPL